MANLYLTHKCRRGCPFCFARKVLKDAGGNLDEILTVEEIRRLLDHFDGQIPVVGLLGGEPFLYPYLEEVLDELTNRKILTKILTSATDPLPEALEKISLEEAVKRRITFLVNVGTRETYNETKWNNLVRFFDKFAPISTLSFTIFDLNGDYNYIFDLVDQFHLLRNVRVGIALPIYNGGNEYIPIEKYKEAGEYFIRCADDAAAREITLSMDCGFAACMFNTEQIGHILKLGGDMNYMCGAALDIGPGLEAWNCFPLFQLGKVKALDYPTIKDLSEALLKNVQDHTDTRPGIMPECDTCDKMIRGLCQGGCKSFKSL